MSNEGSEVPNPKQARLKRIQDSHGARGSIGNFSQTYSVRGRALSDDESSKPMTFEESESETKSYSFQFEKGDKDQDPVKGGDDGGIDRTLYAKLTESVQEQLDSVDEQLERVKNGTSTVGDLGAFIDKIVIRQRSPVLEFDDIDGLKNYNLELVRFSPGSRPVSTEAGNTLVFNNQTNLVSIELSFTDAEKDEEGAIIAAGTTSHVIRSLLRARRDDIFTFVSAAQAPYTNCVLTATATDNTIQFIDVVKGEILFKVPVHNGQTVRTVIAASASASWLAVGFDDLGIQVYEVNSQDDSRSKQASWSKNTNFRTSLEVETSSRPSRSPLVRLSQ